jgi:hypothetical protein
MESIKIKPYELDDIKNNFNFQFFTVRNGKAKYHLLHLPDNSCGLYYAFRFNGLYLEGRRAIEPTDELTCYYII